MYPIRTRFTSQNNHENQPISLHSIDPYKGFGHLVKPLQRWRCDMT